MQLCFYWMYSDPKCRAIPRYLLPELNILFYPFDLLYRLLLAAVTAWGQVAN